MTTLENKHPGTATKKKRKLPSLAKQLNITALENTGTVGGMRQGTSNPSINMSQNISKGHLGPWYLFKKMWALRFLSEPHLATLNFFYKPGIELSQHF